MERLGKRLRTAGVALGGLYAILMTLAVFQYFAFEASHLERVLNWGKLTPSGGVRFEIALISITKTLAFFFPVALIAFVMVLAGCGNRSLLVLVFVGTTLMAWLQLLDRSLFVSVGRHLLDLWAFRDVPGGGHAAGSAMVWLRSSLLLLLWASLAGLFSQWGVRFALSFRFPTSWVARLAWPLLLPISSLLALGICLAIAVGTGLPHYRSHTLSDDVTERLYGAMPVDLRWGPRSVIGFDGDDPQSELNRRWLESYRRHYAALQRLPSPTLPHFESGPRPPIVFIVVESWRADALDPQWMPRLYAWAQSSAHQFTQHQAGTYSSEAGMFALLYGRSNLTFHPTLDAGVAPLVFQWLRSLDYKIGYFTGHPIKWLRREEFLSAQTVDHLAHADDGEWPAWDRRAMDSLVAHVLRAEERRTFSLGFLMSSHFAYQYPPEYERYLPVSKSEFNVTDVFALGPDDRIPHLNRYRNTLAFLDDLIADTLEALPDDTLVVVTGDHGESFYEGGLYGHGVAFSDAVLRVPLLVRFPVGSALARFASPARVDAPTLHRDVIGWVAEYLNGGPLYLEGYQGIADFTRLPAERSILSSYASPTKRRTYGMLSYKDPEQGEIRARITFSSIEPRISFLGYEDQFAQRVGGPELNEHLQRKLFEALLGELTAISQR